MKRIVYAAVLIFLVSCVFASSVWGRSISDIRLDPQPPSTMVCGDPVQVSFDYQNIDTAGLRILVRPYSGSEPSFRSAVNESPAYPGGSGHGSMTFTIRPGDAVEVDAIRVSVYGNGGRKLLFEFALPAKYTFNPGRTIAGAQPMMRIDRPLQIRVPANREDKGQLRVMRLRDNPVLTGERLKIRPDIAGRFIATVPYKIPEPEKQVFFQQVPSIRPPDSPPGADTAWNDQMTNWLSQLNHVLLTEIELIVGENSTVDSLVHFEQGEQISVYEQVGLRLYFLQLTQFKRTSEASDEGNIE